MVLWDIGSNKMDFFSSADMSQWKHCYINSPSGIQALWKLWAYLKDRDASHWLPLCKKFGSPLLLWNWDSVFGIHFFFFPPMHSFSPSLFPSLPVLFSFSSFYNPDCPWTCTNLPASASGVLRLQAWATTQTCVVFLLILSHSSVTFLVICGSLSRD